MCTDPITLKNSSLKFHNDSHLNQVPCGKCPKCISKKRKEWAFRLHEESKDHAYSYFLTLTYTEGDLPYLNTDTGEYPIRLSQHYGKPELHETDRLEKIVYKKDIQDFIKNVRRQQKYHLKNRYQYKIRYYACSEYGTQSTKRPHYHVIMWSLHPNIAHKIELQKIWKHGDAQIKPMDNQISTYYYLTKYLYKQRNYNIWTFKPFALMSTKTHIGNRYLETTAQYHKAKQSLLTDFNGHKTLIPRIYRDKLPRYLTENTYKEIEEYSKEQEKKSLSLYNGKNHHPDILKIFKKIQSHKQHQKELNHFKQLFT